MYGQNIALQAGENKMRMILATRKTRRSRSSKQINLKSINTHKRIENPILYLLLRDQPLLLMNLD